MLKLYKELPIFQSVILAPARGDFFQNLDAVYVCCPVLSSSEIQNSSKSKLSIHMPHDTSKLGLQRSKFLSFFKGCRHIGFLVVGAWHHFDPVILLVHLLE